MNFFFSNKLFLDALFHKGLNRNSFAELAKIPKMTVYGWNDVDNIKKREHIEAIERILGVKYEDLCVPENEPQLESNAVRLNELNPANEGTVQDHNLMWPVIGTSRGGPWISAIDDSEYPGVASEWVQAPKHVKDDNGYALRVIGDSMGPKLPEDARILVAPNLQTENGDIAVVIVANRLGDGRECCVKQVYFEGDNVRLHSLNKAYADIIVESKYVVAIHRVVQAWINMKVEF